MSKLLYNKKLGGDNLLRAMRGKRLFDVVGAAGGLVVFSPVMTLVALAILLEDGRPLLFMLAGTNPTLSAK